MCARCLELDEKIDLYRQLSAWVIDNETRRGIESLIQKYRVDRNELHPSARLREPSGLRLGPPPRRAP